jgi:D-beta-D-heptose 7-phosphate kinase/D-beta-D-heptose 1-phosphate adenosyltransferase
MWAPVVYTYLLAQLKYIIHALYVNIIMTQNNVTVLVSGGFDPLHSGHLALFNAAAALGDRLVVAINSDQYLTRLQGRAFMPWAERAAVIMALSIVDSVILFDDSDDTAVDALNKLKELFPEDRIIYACGHDRTEVACPEASVEGVNMAWRVGGAKIASSSDFLARWTAAQCT